MTDQPLDDYWDPSDDLVFFWDPEEEVLPMPEPEPEEEIDWSAIRFDLVWGHEHIYSWTQPDTPAEANIAAQEQLGEILQQLQSQGVTFSAVPGTLNSEEVIGEWPDVSWYEWLVLPVAVAHATTTTMFRSTVTLRIEGISPQYDWAAGDGILQQIAAINASGEATVGIGFENPLPAWMTPDPDPAMSSSPQLAAISPVAIIAGLVALAAIVWGGASSIKWVSIGVRGYDPRPGVGGLGGSLEDVRKSIQALAALGLIYYGSKFVK